jgi:hypothetical protein
MNNVLFSSIKINKKIDFFVHCQDLLLEYHPNDSFVIKKLDVKDKIYFIKETINKYKGYYYEEDKVCILYNHIFLNDNKNPFSALKENIYKNPSLNYNTVSIDFMVLRELKDCKKFCHEQYSPQVANILFVKNNNPKIYSTLEFIQRLFPMPKILDPLK